MLEKGAEIATKGGIFLEIGVREGGSLKLVIDKLQEFSGFHNVLGVDPWGNIPYIINEGNLSRCNYSNEMRDNAISDLHQYCKNKNCNITIFVLEVSEFFKRFSDGIPVYYNDDKHFLTDYSMVFFDGLHDLKNVMLETKFFIEGNKILNGGTLVYDDVNYYDHDTVEKYILENNFVLIEKTSKKALYQRIENV